MTDKPTESVSEPNRNAIDALHAELPEEKRATGALMRQSVHSEIAEAPPMPDDLLDEILGDLGVRETAAAAPERGRESLLDRILGFMRGTPIAWGIAAAAACLVVLASVKLGHENDSGSTTRNPGGGGATVVTEERPLIILFQPSDELRAAIAIDINPDYLRYPPRRKDLEALLADQKRARIVVADGAIACYAAGKANSTSSYPVPATTGEGVQLLNELHQQFDRSGQ